MLIVIVTGHAFSLSVSLEDPPESEQPSTNKRHIIQGDNDLCEANDSPVSLALHVQLAHTPHKSQLLFRWFSQNEHFV